MPATSSRHYPLALVPCPLSKEHYTMRVLRD